MSDKAKTDLDVTTPGSSKPHVPLSPMGRAEPSTPSEPVAPLLTGTGRRVDASHLPLPETAGNAEITPELPAPIPKDTNPFEAEKEHLLQTSQIVEHMQKKYDELGRRETQLNEQLSTLEQERRSLRLSIHEFEEQMHERQQKLLAQQSNLAEKIAACEKLVGELEEQEQLLLSAREQLAADRAGMKEELQRETQIERQSLENSRNVFEAEKKQLDAQIEENRQSQAQALEEIRHTLASERIAFQQVLTQQHEAEFDDFRKQQQEWTALRDAELAEIKSEREISAKAVQRTQQELISLREKQNEELEEQKQADLQEIEKRKQQFEQQRGVFENRIRFQQTHLHKARQELETAQREFRQEQQAIWLIQEQTETLLQLRTVQLDHYRALMSEREASVEREQQLLAKTRVSFENETKSDRDRIQSEREAWQQERQTQRAEIRRQQDMLAVHADNLEARRARLDTLRSELEETHRTTLELRMSVEEAWAQLTQTAGDETAQLRVDQSREALSEHFHQLRQGLKQQRQELTEAEVHFQKQKDEFRDEHQTLTEWVTQRDEKLRLFDEQLNNQAQSLNARETEWRRARDGWMQERAEAEHVIRSLLTQLTDLNDPNAQELPARPPALSTGTDVVQLGTGSEHQPL